MEKNKNNHINWLGVRLTKKRAIYLTVLSSTGSAFFPLILIDSLWVLKYNNTTVFFDDKLINSYISLLVLSNFIASTICIGIFVYTFSKVKKFRKFLKK